MESKPLNIENKLLTLMGCYTSIDKSLKSIRTTQRLLLLSVIINSITLLLILLLAR